MARAPAWLQSTWQLGTGLFGVAVVVWLISPEIFEGILRRSEPVVAAPPLLRSPDSEEAVGPMSLRGALHEAVQEAVQPKAELSIDARREELQGSTGGLVALGKNLFQSVRDFRREFPEVKSRLEAVLESRENTPEQHRVKPPVPDADSYILYAWFEKHLPYEADFSGFDEAEARFEELSDRSLVTEAEAEELQELVVKCGRDWLRIPYDEQARRFRFSDRPENSPETALENYKKLYKVVMHTPWVKSFEWDFTREPQNQR